MSCMEKIASFIVNKRKAFLVFIGLFFVFCLFSGDWVSVNNELTDYLSEETETKQGLDIMDKNFETFGSATLMLLNIDYDTALQVKAELEEIDGVSGVEFYDAKDEDYIHKDMSEYYHDFAALYQISFDEVPEAKVVQEGIAKIRDLASGYDHYVYTTIDRDDAAQLASEMQVIMVLVVIIILAVLLFTSQTYMEILIFVLTFAAAIVFNKGTNFIFGEISFLSNSVASVLQLALAIDYAIILLHRYMEERATGQAKAALTAALTKAIPEIASSSLTTMAGMAVLMTMQFKIGMDLGMVLLKSIVFSMLSVFLFMPALIMIFDKGIQKTKHKSFVPNIDMVGKAVLKGRYIILPVFMIAIVAAIYLSSKTGFIYSTDSIRVDKKTEYMEAKEEIEKYFDLSNTMAIIVRKGDYEKEAKLLKEIEAYEGVDKAVGLANIKASEDRDYVLTDKILARELAELADIDIDVAKLLYQFYILRNEQYAAMIDGIDNYKISIIDLVDFIYDQIENGGLSLGDDMITEIEDIHKSIEDARTQLEGEEYSRLIFTWDKDIEGAQTFQSIDEIRDIASGYYKEVYVVGDATSNYDLSKAFVSDNLKISILTAVLVGIILLFTFQSAALPFILVLTIQGSIWMNFSIPYLKHMDLFFLSYLIVSSIQMGATIDYAIVITSRYTGLRDEGLEKKEAVIKALNEGFPTIITSGSIMLGASFLIGYISSNPTISSLGNTLFLGVLISVILVIFVLPALLYVFDGVMEKTSFSRRANLMENEE